MSGSLVSFDHIWAPVYVSTGIWHGSWICIDSYAQPKSNFGGGGEGKNEICDSYVVQLTDNVQRTHYGNKSYSAYSDEK